MQEFTLSNNFACIFWISHYRSAASFVDNCRMTYTDWMSELVEDPKKELNFFDFIHEINHLYGWSRGIKIFSTTYIYTFLHQRKNLDTETNHRPRSPTPVIGRARLVILNQYFQKSQNLTFVSGWWLVIADRLWLGISGWVRCWYWWSLIGDCDRYGDWWLVVIGNCDR